MGVARHDSSKKGIPSVDAIAVDLEKRKELGVFYTPNSLSSLLSNWAIRSKHDRILEPSFGGCGFLESAIVRLKSLSSRVPRNNLFGCDVDPAAFHFLAGKVGIANLDKRFLLGDFLSTSITSFSGGKFDVVIGNPPYISHHNLTKDQRKAVNQWRERSELRLNGRASLWAYFVLHALSFLKGGGRMAWVLPGSFVHAKYGQELQKIVASKFLHASALFLGERMFLDAGTEERSVLLLCDGYQDTLTTNTFSAAYCETLDELRANLSSSPSTSLPVTIPTTQPALDELDVLARHDLATSKTHKVKLLGEVANILIGIVTGANHYFILKPSQVKSLGISKRHTRTIAAKFGLLNGIALSEKDTTKWKEEDRPCILFRIADKNITSSEQTYIGTFPEEARLKNSTFKRRANWLDADDNRIPDAFLSYMNHHGPRLVLNNQNLNATNSIHRVYFNSSLSAHEKKLIAISLLTTYSQLSAEICGRNYGSGVLKLEPSEARNIRIALPTTTNRMLINTTFSQIDRLLRRGNIDAAHKLADEFIFGGNPRLTEEQIQHLREKLDMLRKRRRRGETNA